MSRSPPKPYDPAAHEPSVSRRWERAGVFGVPARPGRGRRVFSVVLPPPNITGSLHMGHALNATIQDVIVRYHRMRGEDTLWVAGTDHAGIATQNVVERELAKEGKTRQGLGRAAFEARVWAWKEKYGEIIIGQLKKLGASCDWRRARFTLDEGCTRAVQEAFLHYARKGLLYRGDRVVNWCTRCASAISDLEVAYREEDAVLYTLRYGPLAIATVRPETTFGDMGLAVHPSDARYRAYAGREIEVKTVLGTRRLRVVADSAVDPHFGTGVVKVTPAHDFADFAIGQRHGLPPKQVIGPEGRLNAQAGRFAGMTVAEARPAVVAALKEKGLLLKEESYRHRVGACARCGTVIEPLLSKQWFVRMAPLAAPAIEALTESLIVFHPPRWRAAVRAWLGNVQDWCVSRQLWWGHRLPVWYCQRGRPSAAGTLTSETPDRHVIFSIAKPHECPQCGGTDFVQDPDVLDTWFSSALWPFAVFGWPEATADLRRFFPTGVLVTAPDILNLWVARMVFSSLEFLNPSRYLPARAYGKRRREQQVPFRHVLVHPTVLTLEGRRMSKSKGIAVDPLQLIERYGADATRFGILLQLQEDQQAFRFGEVSIRTARNFVNKLWNVGRFLQRGGRFQSLVAQAPARVFDTWIQARLAETAESVTRDLESFRLGAAARRLHSFVWDDFADWYVEVSKVPGMFIPGSGRDVFQAILGLLHPFLPFVTEALWREYGAKASLLAGAPWPKVETSRRAAAAVRTVNGFQGVVRTIRSGRMLLGITPSAKITVRIRTLRMGTLAPAVAFLAGCREVAAANAPGDWVPLPPHGRGRVDLARAHVDPAVVARRRSEAERRVRAAAARVQALTSRIAAMRGKAPSEALAAQEAARQSAETERTQQAAARDALRKLVRR